MSEEPAIPLPGAEPAGIEARSSIDDIVALYKRDVDRSLLREQLRKTPGERVRDLQAMVCFITELRAAARRLQRIRS